jgi:putative addiction module component (TIGR02574 family)
MSIAEIRQLPLKDKLQVMEAIWEDLRSRADEVAVPGWHKELLDSRDEAVRSGKEEVLDWDAVKDSLGARGK